MPKSRSCAAGPIPRAVDARAVDRSARQDHLIGAKFTQQAVDARHDADATPAVE
jgi:hypothetical protein